MIDWIYDYIIGEVKKKFPKMNISIGAMPVEEGLGIYASVNSVSEDYLARDKGRRLLIVINGKFKTQKECMKLLHDIEKMFVYRRNCQVNNGENCNISHISVSNSPVYAGTEGDKFLYSLGLYIDCYDRGPFCSNPSLT